MKLLFGCFEKMIQEYEDYCDDFIVDFDQAGANSNDTEHFYEEAILWALEKIESMPTVNMEIMGRLRYAFLIDNDNHLGLYQQTVRLETAGRERHYDHYFNQLGGNICSEYKGRNASRAFFAKYPDYTLIVPIGMSILVI